MSLPSKRTMDRARALVTRSLVDTALITRTGVTVPCRVDDGRREERLEGLPHFVRTRRWAIVMPDRGQGWDGDVKGGDIIEVTDHTTGVIAGTYSVLDAISGDTPTTDSVSTTAYCIMQRDANGTLALPTNEVATFNASGDEANAVTENVLIYEASADLEIAPAQAAKYKLAVQYDPTLRDKAGKLVSGNWQITWTQPNGIERTENLSKPRYLYGPCPVAVAYFDVIS